MFRIKVKYQYVMGLFLIYGMAIMVSCKSTPIIAQNFSILNESWSYQQAIDTSFTITDIQKNYHIYFNLRNSSSYPYQNIFVMYQLYADGEKPSKNNLKRYEFPLADIDGKWLGKGSGAIYHSQFLIAQGVKFPKAGKYHIFIEQNMRDNPLKGISDIGFSVEEVKN